MHVLVVLLLYKRILHIIFLLLSYISSFCFLLTHQIIYVNVSDLSTCIIGDGEQNVGLPDFNFIFIYQFIE